MLNTKDISNVSMNKARFSSPTQNSNLTNFKAICLLVLQNAFFMHRCGSFSHGLFSLVHASQITHAVSYSDFTDSRAARLPETHATHIPLSYAENYTHGA